MKNTLITGGLIGTLVIGSVVAVNYKSIKISSPAYAIVQAYSKNNKMTLQDSASAIIVDQSKFYEALTDYCENDWMLGYRSTTTKGLLKCFEPLEATTTATSTEPN